MTRPQSVSTDPSTGTSTDASTDAGSAEWLVVEDGWDPRRANVWETQFTVGNGYLGTRGTLEEGHRGELSGTYLNGVYDAHDSPVIDLVNVPDWLDVAVHVDGVRLDVQTCRVVEHQRVLDLRQGVLRRRTVFEDSAGRRTRLETRRFVSMADRELCGLQLLVTPENHSSVVTVDSGVAGHRRNLDRLPAYPAGTTFHPEVTWDKWALSRHLEEVGRETRGDADGAPSLCLQMRTVDSEVTVTVAARTEFSAAPAQRLEIEQTEEYERLAARARCRLEQGSTLQVEKTAVLMRSRAGVDEEPETAGSADEGSTEAGSADDARRARALERLAELSAAGFEGALARSRARWEEMWQACDCEILGDPEAARAVRFGIYHLLIAANGEDPTVNIGAKSLSGEGYRGHVFWDTEIFMLPFFIYTQPETARSLLRYRHHTLPGARARSRDAGTSGARYAWESADTGREECPAWTVDGVNRIWARDEEVHVSADVAYGIRSYVTATGDRGFLRDFGAEILFETSRFWADRVEPGPQEGTYSIRQVMGPDEFHSHVDDNAFTNHMARWHLQQAVEVHAWIRSEHPEVLTELASRLDLQDSEPEHWARIAEGLGVRTQPSGLIEQFDGYFDRKDVPITAWDANDMPQYPEGYHHFNCEETMLLKQPDVVMLPYMLPDDFTEEQKRVNFEFYEARTLHKSSLSPAIHAIMGLAVGDRDRAMQYFRRSAFVDLHDNQGNTADGMHIASAAGTWQIVVAGFAGFRVMEGRMTFAPWLPEEWEGIRFRLRWQQAVVHVDVGPESTTFRLDAPEARPLEIEVHGERVELAPGEDVRVPTGR